MPDPSATPMIPGPQGYGKLIAGFIASPIAAAIVETADQYLPKPLPTSVHDAVELLVVLAVVFLVPHDLMTRLTGPSN